MLKQIKSRKRMIAQIRKEANKEVLDYEGKVHISYLRYRELANEAFVGSRTDFDAKLHHPFLLLGWNSITRSNTVGTLLWDSIGWSEDSLAIIFEKSKTNQEGKDIVPVKRKIFDSLILYDTLSV